MSTVCSAYEAPVFFIVYKVEKHYISSTFIISTSCAWCDRHYDNQSSIFSVR